MLQVVILLMAVLLLQWVLALKFVKLHLLLEVDLIVWDLVLLI